MGLNKETGEQLDGMDEVFVVAPFEKYAALPRLTALVEEMTGTKFKRRVQVERPIVEVAMRHAQEVYLDAGLPRGGQIDVLVQEYPRTQMIAFVFCARIKGEDRYVVAPFGLSNTQVAELTQAGYWTPYTVH